MLLCVAFVQSQNPYCGYVRSKSCQVYLNWLPSNKKGVQELSPSQSLGLCVNFHLTQNAILISQLSTLVREHSRSLVCLRAQREEAEESHNET